MKILQVARQFSPSIGGIENVTRGLSLALQQQGHNLDILTLRRIFSSGQLAPATARVDGLETYRIPSLGSRRYPIAPAVLSFVRSYDLVHVHAIDFFIDFLSATRPLHRKPIIVNTHGGIFHTRWLYPLKQIYFHTLTRFMLRGAAAVICVSRQDYQLFSKIVPREKLHVIENGVDVEPYQAVAKHIERALLVGVGRVVKNKGIERLIAALPALAREFPDVHVVWIGNDPNGRVPQLMAQAEQLGVANRVQFLGNVPDTELRAVLSRAHLFVSPATYEAFGVSTIEAMSSGTVPVVAPVGVHPQVIHDGETGFLCDFEGEDGTMPLRYALQLDIERLAEIGASARAIAARYAWSEVVKSYLRVYDSVLVDERRSIS